MSASTKSIVAPSTCGRLSGSTATSMPARCTTASPGSGASSSASPYCTAQQLCPATYTRTTRCVGLPAMSPASFSAASGVTSIISSVTYHPCPANFAGMDRDAAYALLCEHTKGDSLRKHGLAVEAAMRRFAARFDGDEEEWAVTGLLHDFDYERDPDGHPQNGKPILEQAGVPGRIVHAIQSHADHTGVPRVTPMEKTLSAVDELCGFVTAVALVRPSQRVAEVEPSSVRKKMKDKAI